MPRNPHRDPDGNLINFFTPLPLPARVSHMNTTLAILLAQSLSLTACILFAVWYVVPWLESRSRTEALVPLVWVHRVFNRPGGDRLFPP
jgi:hypothetical protein